MIAPRGYQGESSGTSGARPRPVVDPDRTVRLTIRSFGVTGWFGRGRSTERTRRSRPPREEINLTTPGCRPVSLRRFDGRQHFGERLVDSSSCGEDGDASRGPHDSSCRHESGNRLSTHKPNERTGRRFRSGAMRRVASGLGGTRRESRSRVHAVFKTAMPPWRPWGFVKRVSGARADLRKSVLSFGPPKAPPEWLGARRLP